MAFLNVLLLRFFLKYLPTMLWSLTVIKNLHISRCAPDLADRANENPKSVTDAEWRQLLSSVQYQVKRRAVGLDYMEKIKKRETEKVEKRKNWLER